MSRKLITTLAPPALDLKKRHFEVTKNGIIVIGTWLREGRRKFEPCLVLLHAGRPIQAGRTVPIVIKLADAWKWALHGDVGDPAHCVRSIMGWLHAELLPGNPASKRDHIQIMEVINSRLTDLIAMPPMPVGDRHTIADVIMTNKHTGATTEREVTFDV